MLIFNLQISQVIDSFRDFYYLECGGATGMSYITDIDLDSPRHSL